MNDAINTIENDAVYQRIKKDSFGGVMYDISNRNKYNADHLIATWDSMTASQQESAGGIIRGAIGFLKEYEV